MTDENALESIVEFGPAQFNAAHQTIPVDSIIDHYQVLRLLGTGPMSDVYVARDVALGRRVALKLISSELKRTTGAVDQFKQEARLMAQLSHPNVINVFGVGEFNGSPYIAMEFVEGETLRQRIRGEALSLKTTLRYALAIASALREAHATNILHGDLKPDNAIIPPDGRLRVLDFGLAKLVSDWSDPTRKPPLVVPQAPIDERTGRLSGEELVGKSVNASMDLTGGKGTPPYMAPEQWDGLTRTKAVDVWAFGVIVFELLAGRRPFEADSLPELAYKIAREPIPRLETRRDVPEALANLVSRCLQRPPELRPTAQELEDVMRRLIQGETTLVDDESPFRGLNAFTEEHARFFFGREDEVTTFAERVRTEVVLPIIGASGVGKSSFVQAGVVPRLRESGEWAIVRTRPGGDPFRALAARFTRDLRTDNGSATPTQPVSSTVAETDVLAQELYDHPKKLALILRQRAQAEKVSVLLLVDQLEEVCTLVSDRETRLRFLAAVASAADDPQERVRVIFTARDDFLTRLAESPEMARTLSRVTVLRPPGPEALEVILQRPLELFGYRYDDPTLPAAMVNEVANEAAVLPLLQFAATMLWDRRDTSSQTLSRAVYDAIGGVQGALATHANAFMRGQSEAQSRTVRSLMLRLVTPDGTRKVAQRKILCDTLGVGAEQLINQLVDSRLLSVRQVMDDSFVELSHESLVHTWEHLRHWLEEGREELLFLADVEQAATLWDKRGRRTSEVWSGNAIAEALRNIDRFRCQLPQVARDFIEASGLAERRRLRRRKVLLGAAAMSLVAIAVVSIVTAVSFADKRRIAEEQRAQAQAEGARSAYQRGDHVAARAQLRVSMETQDSALARAVYSKLARDTVIWRRTLPSMTYDLSVAPNGTMLAAASLDHSVYLVDIDTAQYTALRQLEDQVLGLSYSPDGQWLVAADVKGNVGVWRTDDLSYRRLVTEGGTWKVAVSPDSKRLATAGFDGKVRVFQLSDGKPLLTLTLSPEGVHRLVFSPDGRYIAADAGGGSIAMYATESGERHAVFRGGHQAAVYALAFNADGSELLSGSEDKSIAHWRVNGTQLINRWVAHDGPVTDLAIDPDGKSALSVSYDSVLKRWQLPSGTLQQQWRGHESGVVAVKHVGQNAVVTAGHGDRTLLLRNLTRTQTQNQDRGHDGPLQLVRFSRDGKFVLSGGDDKIVRVWDAKQGDEVKRFTGHGDAINAIDTSPDGQLVASGSYDKTIRLWSFASGELVRELKGHENAINDVWFSPSGKDLVSVSTDRSIRVWDVASGRQRQQHRLGDEPRSLAAGTATLVIPTFQSGHYVMSDLLSPPQLRTGSGWGAAVARDDSKYFIANERGEIELYRADGHLLRKDAVSQANGRSGGFHPDGTWAGAGFVDGAYMWPVAQPHQAIKLEGHIGEVSDLVFDPLGRYAATAGDDGTVRVWNSAGGAPAWRGVALMRTAGHVLTHRGWQSFSGGGEAVAPALREHIETEAEWAEESQGTMCMRTITGRAELWRDEKRVAQVDASDEVRLSQFGCLVRHNKQLGLLTDTGAVRQLSNNASAFASSESAIAAVEGDTLVVFAKDQTTARYVVGEGVTAIGGGKDWMALGFGNGSIELMDLPSGKRRRLNIDTPPTGTVVRLSEGPMDTVVAGYANGTVGLWTRRGGAELTRAKLHGPPRAMTTRQGRLVVLTTLGDLGDFDISVFDKTHCDLLRDVWADTAVTWELGEAVRSPPPAQHACSGLR